MKAAFVTCLLVFSICVLPLAASHATSRPLNRYLTATLHLKRHKARQVQRALRRDPLNLNTPEQIAERLRPVLTTAQYDRYTDLQSDVTAYEMLNRLMAQH